MGSATGKPVRRLVIRSDPNELLQPQYERDSMTTMQHKIRREITALALTSLYFGTWLLALLFVKHLLLAEYNIRFYGWSAAIVGTLVLAKVVLVLEHVPLGRRIESSPAWIGILARTALYSAGVVVVLGIEHGLRGAREHGGFIKALTAESESVNIDHLWVNVICLTAAILFLNTYVVLHRRIGGSAIRQIYLQPPPGEALAADGSND